MATIANLDINLGARVAGFEKGMKTAQTAIKKLQSSANDVGSKFIGMAKGMAVAAATALAAKFSFGAIAGAFERLDALSKSSDTFGIAVDDLQALHIAADLAGVSTETVARAMFKSGLSLDQFMAAADAISQIENAQERNAIATKLFGKAAQELMPLLNAGSGAIKEAKADMDRFGLSLSKVDVAGIEMANDALTRIHNVFDGIINKIAVEAAPLITGLAEWFIDGAAGAMSFGEMIEAAMDVAAVAIASAATSWQIFGAPIKLIGAGILELVSLIADALGSLQRLAGYDSKIADKIARSSEKLATGLFDNAIEGFTSGVTGKTFTDLMGRFESAKERAKAAADSKRGGGFSPFAESGRSDKAIGPAAALERGTAAAASAILKGRSQVTEGDKITHKALHKNNELLMRLIQDKGLGLAVAEI